MNTFLIAWFAVTIVAAAWLTYDLVKHQPEILGIIKVAWILVVLYLGIPGLILYLLSCREPARMSHEEFIAPMWKQAVGSTIHCTAGDALGIIAVAVIVSNADMPAWGEFLAEYLAAFLFGWLIFQSLAMGRMMGGFRKVLPKAFVAEGVSLTVMCVGMFPAMYWFMGMNHMSSMGHGGSQPGAMPAGSMAAMSPSDLRWWAAMAGAIAVGAVFAYPVNWWLVATGRKHGMASKSVMGMGAMSGAEMSGSHEASTA